MSYLPYLRWRRRRRIRRTIIGILLLSSLSPSLSAQRYTISEQGLQTIKAFEACRLKAYPDAGGWSIGYGHHGRDVHPGMTITQEQADRLLEKDILRREASIRRLLDGLPYTYHFPQGVIDALFSLVYNCGERRVRESEFYRRLRECDPRDFYTSEHGFLYAAEAIPTTAVSTPGLKRRREAEYTMLFKHCNTISR